MNTLEEGTVAEVDFEKIRRAAKSPQGLIPVVLQHADTLDVLFVGYANELALRETLSSGRAVLWSASRDELWRKGATSGNTLAVRALRYDCDGDALLALVAPAGPACHTGERSCFHRGELEPQSPGEVLATLERTIESRARSRPEGSYTVTLLDDSTLAGAKVQEEAEEVVRAAREESDDRVAEESADVLYHLAVLLRGRNLSLADAERVLDGRRRR